MRTLRISALLATVALLAAAPAALADHGETVFFEAPGDLLGVPADHQAKMLAQLASLGVRALRVTLYWRDVAPKPNHRTARTSTRRTRTPMTGAATTR